MKDDTFTINSFSTMDVPVYDGDLPVGSETINTVNITYCVHGQEYTQDLMNLPFDDATALQTAIGNYVADAKVQLAPAESALPLAVQDLAEQTFLVSKTIARSSL